MGGYELQINNEDAKWATGSIENFIQRLLPVAPAANIWHSYRVDVRGGHLVATLDGAKVLDGHDSKFRTGYIGLQHHKGNPIAFRHIWVQPVQRRGLYDWSRIDSPTSLQVHHRRGSGLRSGIGPGVDALSSTRREA